MTKATLRRVVLITLITGVVSSYQACGPAGTSANQTSSKSMKGGYSNGGTTTDNPKVTVNLMIASYNSQNVTGADLCVKEIKFDSQDGSQSAAVPAEGPAQVLGLDKGSSMTIQSRSSSRSSSASLFKWIFGKKDNDDDDDGDHEWDDGDDDNESYGGLDIDEYISELTDQYFSYFPPQSQYWAPPSGAHMDKFEVPTKEYSQVEISLEPNCTKGSLNVINSNGSQVSSKKSLKMRFKGKVKLKAAGDLKLDMQKIIDALSSAQSGEDFQAILDQTPGDLL